MDVLELTGYELADIVASPSATEELSAAAGVAMVMVDLSTAQADGRFSGVGAALDTVSLLPCVLVARLSPTSAPPWWELADRCDVLLSPDPDDDGESALFDRGMVTATESDVDDLRRNVLRAPLAAVALAMLLRHGSSRSITQGLESESTLYSLLQAGPEFASWRAARTSTPHFDQGTAVTVERSGPVLHITLARPQVHNALNRRMRDELAEALLVAALDDSVTSVVLDGAGPSFCSGGDLNEFGLFGDPMTSHVTRLSRSPARLLSRIANRTRVHLHGACMGAGIELPAFAARVTATEDAVMALPELGIGLIPGAGGTVSIPRRIGQHRAAYLALSGCRIDAVRALRWGLIDDITDADVTETDSTGTAVLEHFGGS